MTSPSVLLRRPRRVLALGAVAALTLAAAGCGSSGGSSGNADADPATAVPASAPLYVQAVVQPDGTLKSDTEAALKKILRTDDPGAKIEKLIEDADDEGDRVDFEKDVTPWLGKRVGLFATGFTGKGVYAAVIAQKDSDKAKDFVQKQAKGDKGDKDPVKRPYKGVDFYVDPDDGSVAGVDGDFVIAGTVEGAHEAVDVLKDDGQTLADDSEYKASRGQVGTDGLADGFVSVNGIVDALSRSGSIPPAALTVVRQALASSAPKSLGFKVRGSGSGVALDVAAKTVTSSVPADQGDGPGALKALPGDAWFGVGIGALGAKLSQALDQLSNAGGIAGIGIGTVLDQFREQTGLDLRSDLLDWMGDAGVFVRGTSLGDVGGALVVHSKDPAKTRAAIGKIGRALRQLGAGRFSVSSADVDGAQRAIEITPASTGTLGGGTKLDVYLVAAGDTFVAAVGRPALAAALKPATTLGDNADFTKATGTLGSGLQPAFFLDLAPILNFAEGLGAGSNPQYTKAKPYLDAFLGLIAGAKVDSGTTHARVVAVLK